MAAAASPRTFSTQRILLYVPYELLHNKRERNFVPSGLDPDVENLVADEKS